MSLSEGLRSAEGDIVEWTLVLTERGLVIYKSVFSIRVDRNEQIESQQIYNICEKSGGLGRRCSRVGQEVGGNSAAIDR